MSGQTAWLVQRFAENGPNSMAGCWVDEGIARDLKADEGAKAVEQLADPNYPGKRRAIKWDHVAEFETTSGTASVEPVTKEAGHE